MNWLSLALFLFKKQVYILLKLTKNMEINSTLVDFIELT